jgi:hypothetical protein
VAAGRRARSGGPGRPARSRPGPPIRHRGWIAGTGNGIRTTSSSRNAVAVPTGHPDPHHGHPADDIDRRDLAAFDAGQGPQVHRVELDQGTWCGRLPLGLGNPRGVGPLGARPADPHGAGLAQEGAAAQAAQHPADHRGAEPDALAAQEDLEWPPRQDGVLVGGGPGRLPGPLRTARARFEAGQVGRAIPGLLAGERRPGHPKPGGRVGDASALRAGTWGRVHWTRSGTWRTTGKPPPMPSWCIRPSHMCLNSYTLRGVGRVLWCLLTDRRGIVSL